jgi:hypothetical protein
MTNFRTILPEVIIMRVKTMSKYGVPILLAILAAGCINFRQTGRDLGDGVTESLLLRSDSLAALTGKIVRSVRDTALARETQIRLAAIVGELGDSLLRQASLARDTLLGDYTRLWVARLKDDLLGASTRKQIGGLRDELIGLRTQAYITGLRDELLGRRTTALVGDLRDELLGPRTNNQLMTLVSSLRDELIGDSTRARAGLLRDELLGPGTRSAIDSIVLATLKRTGEFSEEQQGFIKRNATALLWTAGGVIVAILGAAAFFFVRNRKQQTLLEVLTHQIHKMPDQASYDDLTARIHDRAQEAGVEPYLRKMLVNHGTIGPENWKPAAAGG